jgi:hypothetical protein
MEGYTVTTRLVGRIAPANVFVARVFFALFLQLSLLRAPKAAKL